MVLSDEVWLEHIQVHHPEVTIEDLRLTIEDPDEIQLSPLRSDVDLYYRLKVTSRIDRIRYWMVAVKKISAGNFVSSAMTKTKIVGSKLVYRKR
ncbi:hypothetical protein D3C72_2248960 [compost metagenome]